MSINYLFISVCDLFSLFNYDLLKLPTFLLLLQGLFQLFLHFLLHVRQDNCGELFRNRIVKALFDLENVSLNLFL